jgi:hypothetical protein
MTKSELMVLKLIEEAAEVQQRAAKLMQFGPEESQATALRNLGGNDAPQGTNRERLQAELLDLCAVAQLLGFRYPTPEEVSGKLTKIERYWEYSLECGVLR